MREVVPWIGVLGIVACTRGNPSFEDDTTTTEATGSTPTSTVTTATSDGSSGSSGLDDTAGPDGTTGSTDSATGPSTDATDTDEPPPGACAGDLYAINELGQLHVIDVDAPSVTLAIVPSKSLASRALATEPNDGVLHYTQVGELDVWRIDPGDFTVEPVPVPFPDPAGLWPGFVRAAFDEAGVLYLGTADSQRFARFVPGGMLLEDSQFAMGGFGGDLAFLPDGRALVTSSDGTAYFADFMTVLGLPVPVTGLTPDVELTGVARDGTGRIWASTSEPQSTLVHLDVVLEPESVTVIEADSFETGIAIDDLAPIVVLPDGC